MSNSRNSGIAGHSYYPRTATALAIEILEQADFHGLTEVSRFASAMVQIASDQETLLVDLQRRLLDLEIAAGK
jgi:hypothetical protein